MNRSLFFKPTLAALFLGGVGLIEPTTATAATPVVAKAHLNDVRLFLDGAVLNHSFSVTVPAGSSSIEVVGLAAQVDQQSLQLRTRSGLKVNGYRFFSREKDLNEFPELKIWRDSLDFWKGAEEQARSQQAVVQLEKDAFLRSSQQTAYTEANHKFWAQLAQDWTRRASAAQKSLERAQSGTRRVTEKLAEKGSEISREETVLVLEVVADAPVTAALFYLEYSTSTARWFPRYELRLDDPASPRMELISKANVFQETGLDWKKVTISVGSDRPRGGIQKPVLTPWWVRPNGDIQIMKDDMESSEMVMPVSGVAVKSARSKHEAPTAGYNFAQRTESLVGYSMTLPGTHSLAHRERRELSLNNQMLPVQLSRYAAPRLDQRVFLVARIPGWDTLIQVNGPSNIYLENNLVGSSFLAFGTDVDTLDLALGADPRTSVEWKSELMANNKGAKMERTYSYELKLKTLYAAPVEVLIEDRTPLPQAEEITLLNAEWGGGKRSTDTGMVLWKTTVSKDKPWSAAYRYTLRYPRNAAVGPL